MLLPLLRLWGPSQESLLSLHLSIQHVLLLSERPAIRSLLPLFLALLTSRLLEIAFRALSAQWRRGLSEPGLQVSGQERSCRREFTPRTGLLLWICVVVSTQLPGVRVWNPLPSTGHQVPIGGGLEIWRDLTPFHSPSRVRRSRLSICEQLDSERRRFRSCHSFCRDGDGNGIGRNGGRGRCFGVGGFGHGLRGFGAIRARVARSSYHGWRLRGFCVGGYEAPGRRSFGSSRRFHPSFPFGEGKSRRRGWSDWGFLSFCRPQEFWWSMGSSTP